MNAADPLAWVLRKVEGPADVPCGIGGRDPHASRQPAEPEGEHARADGANVGPPVDHERDARRLRDPEDEAAEGNSPQSRRDRVDPK